MVTIELPPAAKTSYTVFRWWQPQQGSSDLSLNTGVFHVCQFCLFVKILPSICRLAGKQSAQWALDDILIGMNDSSRTGFHDKFDGSTPLRHNWYRIQGGEVTVDCLSLDTVLTFNSEAIDSKCKR